VKKFSAILICLLMIVTCGLAGCASFSINKVKYYNEVLATVDDTKITRFDLLTAYNSYGQSLYVQQKGESEKKALASTLDMLIDQELIYQYAKDNDALYRPTEYQVNEIVQKIFDSLDDQMQDYIEKAKKILNIKDDEEETPAEESETPKAYKLSDYMYQKRAEVKSKVVDGKVQYYIEYREETEDPNYVKLIAKDHLTNFTSKETVEAIQTKYFEHLLADLTDEYKSDANAILIQVKKLFANDLIDYEYYLRDKNGKKYSTDSESLFNRSFERTFESQIQYQYLENVRTYYLKNEELNIQLLVDEFKYMAEYSHDKYNTKHELYNTTMKDIGTKGDTILYHPQTDAQFGYFIHTLFSFDDLKENLELLKEEKDPDKYEIAYNEFINSLEVKQRVYNASTDAYEESSTKVKFLDALKEYKALAEGSYDNVEQKMSAFKDFIFRFTGDDGTLSSGMPYVVGTNGFSGMEPSFTDEAINLMKGEVGNMSTVDIYDTDTWCITPYGVHVLFYIGDVDSFDIPYDDLSNVYIQNEDIENQEMFNLYTKIINPLTKETYFDMMFDHVYPASADENFTTKNGYTKHEEEITEISKQTHKVVKNKTKIKATKVSL